MNRILLPALFAAISFCTTARSQGTFQAQMSILKEKIGLCNAELDTIKKSARACEDFSQYSDFLFKGNAMGYIQYHIENGDINQKNSKDVLNILHTSVKTMNRIMSPL